MILEFIVGDRASNIAKIPRDPAKKRRFSPRQQLSSRQPRHVSLQAPSFQDRGWSSRWPVEIRKRAGKSGEFPEQCIVSIRVSVGVAMRWTLVQLGEVGRKREDGMSVRGSGTGLQREVLSVAKLPSSSRRTYSSYDHSPPLSLRPLLLLQIYKLSHSRDRTHGRIEPPQRQIRWNRPVNTASKRRRLSLFETARISPTYSASSSSSSSSSSLLVSFSCGDTLPRLASTLVGSLRPLFDLRVSSKK